MSVFVVRRVLRKLLLSTHTHTIYCMFAKVNLKMVQAMHAFELSPRESRPAWACVLNGKSVCACKKNTSDVANASLESQSSYPLRFILQNPLIFLLTADCFFSFWRVLWPTGIKFFWYKLKWVALRVAAIQVKITANASLFWKWLWLPYWNHQEIISLSRDPHQKWQSFSKVKALGSNGIPEGSTPISLATGECSCFEASTNINQE